MLESINEVLLMNFYYVYRLTCDHPESQKKRVRGSEGNGGPSVRGWEISSDTPNKTRQAQEGKPNSTAHKAKVTQSAVQTAHLAALTPKESRASEFRGPAGAITESQ